MAPHQKHSCSALAVVAAVLIGLATGAHAAPVARGLDLCQSYTRVCNDFTSQMDCRSRFDKQESKPMLDVRSCTGVSYDTFVGRCQCAALDASAAVLQELVDYSVTPALPHIMVASKTAPNTTDYGATYVKACSTFLAGAACPTNLQVVAGYGGKADMAGFKGSCACGALDVSDAIRESLNAYLIQQKIGTTTTVVAAPAPAALNATAQAPVPAAGGLDVCPTFIGVCRTFLEDVGCPMPLRTKLGCATAGGPETLQGACRCGALDASESVKIALLGLTLPAAALQAAKVLRTEEQPAAGSVRSAKLGAPSAAAAGPRVEFCHTYANACAEFLTAAGIKPELHEAESNCVGGNGTNLATFSGYCGAGSFNVSKALTAFMVRESVGEVDKLLCLGGSCSHNTMSHGVIAMVAVGAALLAVVLGLLAYLRSERRKQQAKTPAPTVDDFYA